ncbi:hypothetical protein EX895_001826 [Sporisorium graminicola]|uniref:Uncharacterized protein n=1 Tax=Sporisorium graminicola TaxID=280036 RepID=A0A4U7KWZ6_9BASI|nr:hypothetical protein EX895_001826 [Sporisorium graminicola]TKY89295.1 hypothetical protein EX895_001826 [Sporisorium graminicola]
MTVKLIFFGLALLAAAMVRAPSPAPEEIQSKLHVMQEFAKDVYPDNLGMQKKAVMTLNYIFRDEWASRMYRFSRINDFLRTGGLKTAPQSRNSVSEAEAFNHLLRAPEYHEQPRYSKPALDLIITNNLRQAKAVNNFHDAVILTHQKLHTDPRTLARLNLDVPPGQTDVFNSLRRPKTLEELQSGDTWPGAGSSSSRARHTRVTDPGQLGYIDPKSHDYPFDLINRGPYDDVPSGL